jgi:repressor LexA
MALTKRQKQVLDFIADFVERNGYSPSYEELASGLDLASLATVHKHIQALQSKQYLNRSFNHSRSLEVTSKYLDERRAYSQPQPAVDSVPLAGRIAAGAPVEAIEGQDTLSFSDFVGDPGTFALKVSGDSMIDDHICDGDYVLIEKTSEVRNGDVVAALVDGNETTLKRFYDEGDVVRLQPANATVQPIRVPKAQLQIQGRLLAVLRKYK